MNDPQLEKELREFLLAERNRRDTGRTVEGLYDAFKKYASERMVERISQARYARRLKKTEHQLALISNSLPTVPNWEADEEDITGTHKYEQIRKATEELEDKFEAEKDKELAAARESKIWWRRQGWIWVFCLFTLITGGLLNTCSTVILRRIEMLDTKK